jgi:DNA-binding CsgD family transcriptional regulator/PAS domain-containing protein
MSDTDRLLETIEAVYASGVDDSCWPQALKLTTNLIGGVGTFLEVVDKPARQYNVFCTASTLTDTSARSFEHFAKLAPRMPFNPRRSFSFSKRAGHLSWDHKILDEAGMRRDPFYSEFLPQFGLRYFLGAVLEQTSEKFTFVTVQRTHKQGHVEKREIGLMQRLCPHFQRAHDMTTRLKVAGETRGLLEDTLDWLTDGVALLRADGDIVYANDTMRALAKRGDGFRIVGRVIEFAEPGARRQFDATLGAVERRGDASCDARPTDFPVARNDGSPAYIVSMRPLLSGHTRGTQHPQASIMVLVRDPLLRNAAASQILQDLFTLTKAEAHLAQALCTGMTTGAYATERCVSLNTVYSHLKRIREKTGCKSVPELILKFSELNVPLRLNGPLESAQRTPH